MLIRYILFRFLYAIITLYCIITLFFFITYIIYGNHNAFNLIAEYLVYLKKLFQGDLGYSFGYSFSKSSQVIELVTPALSNTLKLGIPSFIISMLIAFGLGITGAVHRDSYLDKGIKFLSVMGISIPPFWVTIMLLLVFTVYFQILPIYSVVNNIFSLTYILPASAMIYLNFPITMRLVRSAMLETLNKEYIKLARIKGLPERTVILKHALRNCLIIPLTSAGLIFSFMLAGSFIVENVFLWPGLGNLALNAFFQKDYPVIQAFVLILTVLLLLINFFVDISYAILDPQIRYQKHKK